MDATDNDIALHAVYEPFLRMAFLFSGSLLEQKHLAALYVGRINLTKRIIRN